MVFAATFPDSLECQHCSAASVLQLIESRPQLLVGKPLMNWIILEYYPSDKDLSGSHSSQTKLVIDTAVIGFLKTYNTRKLSADLFPTMHLRFLVYTCPQLLVRQTGLVLE